MEAAIWIYCGVCYAALIALMTAAFYKEPTELWRMKESAVATCIFAPFTAPLLPVAIYLDLFTDTFDREVDDTPHDHAFFREHPWVAERDDGDMSPCPRPGEEAARVRGDYDVKEEGE